MTQIYQVSVVRYGVPALLNVYAGSPAEASARAADQGQAIQQAQQTPGSGPAPAAPVAVVSEFPSVSPVPRGH